MNTTNNEIFLRPRFSIDFDKDSNELIDTFKSNLASGDCKYCSRIIDGHVIIDIPLQESHFWSPQLHIEIEETSEGKSVVKGLFGPKPQVWTLFMFVHFGVATAFLSFLVVAYSNWALKESYFFSGLMLIVLPVFWIGLYFLGRLGKATGKEQMSELKAFMQKTLQKIER